MGRKWSGAQRAMLVLSICFLIGAAGFSFYSATRPMGASYIILTSQERPAETVQIAAKAERPAPTLPLNINTATAEELCMLPGIGETLAGRIVAYRTDNGPFSAAEDLMKVEGIGTGIFEQLRGSITVEEKVA